MPHKNASIVDNTDVITPCSITDVQTLFTAELPKNVASTLFAVLKDKPIHHWNTMLDTVALKNNRDLLTLGKKLQDSQEYEHLAIFLEHPLIKRTFTLAIAHLTKNHRIAPWTIQEGTEHATYRDGQPSIEKITAWLRSQKK